MQSLNQKFNRLKRFLRNSKKLVLFGFIILSFSILVSAVTRPVPIARAQTEPNQSVQPNQSVAPSPNGGTPSAGANSGSKLPSGDPQVQNGGANAATNPANIFSKDYWVGVASSMLLYVAQLGIRITLFLFTFIIQISAYNGYLDATAVNVGWVMVRDMTNMLFVIVLLVIAFGTILGLEQYEWKKMMVKFVLAAVLVNFSRLICGVLIDISQLVMTTFINGIVATAGGNLINAFNLARITQLNQAVQPNQLTSPGIFSASVMAVIFSLVTLYTIGIFVFILAKRLITLWVLIVLSPMAFVLSIVPSTESASSRWWSELMDNLVTGPVILFFIWLSFVTVGNGDINSEISNSAGNQIGQQYVIKNGSTISADQVQIGGQVQSAGVGDGMGWNQMASFIIAVGMLIAGAEVAQSIGGSSGSALTGVADFAKKVGTIASGVAVGRWLYGKGSQAGSAVVGAAGKAAGFVAMDVLPVRATGERIGNWAKGHIESFKTGSRMTPGMLMPQTELDASGRRVRVKRVNPETGKLEDVMVRYEPRGIMRAYHAYTSVFGSRSQKLAASRKRLKKTQDMGAKMEELQMSETRGVPGGIFMPGGLDFDGVDRWVEGKIEAQKMRSNAKTADIKGAAIASELQGSRRQYDPSNPRADARGFVYRDDTLLHEIEQHNLNAQNSAAIRARVEAKAKMEIGMKAENRDTMRAIQLNKELVATYGNKLKTEEIRQRREAFSKEAAGQKILAESVAAGKEEHLEVERESELRKQAETAFVESGHGAAELREAAAIALQMKEYEARIGRQKATQERGAAAAMGETLQTTQEAALETQAQQARTKESEAEAAQRAAAVQVEALREVERAKLGQTLAETQGKEIKEGAETEVKGEATATGQMRATQRAEIRINEQKAEQKVKEEAAKTFAAQIEEPALQRTRESEILAADETARAKEAQAEASRAAAAARADVLRNTRATEIRSSMQDAGTKETEARAKALAAADEEDSLRLAKEAEARASLAAAQEKTVEGRAKRDATRNMRVPLQAAQESILEAVTLGEENKETEAQIKNAAARNQVAEITSAERAKIRASEQEALTKETQTGAKAVASNIENLALYRAKRAELRAAEAAGQQKLSEERATARANRKEAAAGTLRRTEGAKLEAQSVASIIPKLQAKALEQYLDGNTIGQGFLKNISLNELATQGAKSFVDQIKQAELGKIFKDSSESLANAMKDLKNGTSFDAVVQNLKGGSEAQQVAHAQLMEIKSNYFKDTVVSTARNTAVDQADSLWTLERNGYELPVTAYKKLSKKMQENLQGVEREKAVSTVTNSMMKLLKAKADGNTLEVDQEAQFMGQMEYLLKNGWSDDLLARFTEVAADYRAGKYAGKSNEAEAANISDLVFNKFRWAEYDSSGDVKNLVNTSSEKRTNDLQRMLGFAGDVKMLQSENAVLLHQRAQKDLGTSLSYEDAAKDLSEKLRTGTMSVAENEAMVAAGKKLGWDLQRVTDQLDSFTGEFVTGLSDSQASLEKYRDKIKNFSQQQEVIADWKPIGMQTTHIDDVGHGKFDMDAGFAHGQLSDDAMAFVRGDWRKMDGGARMRNLKSHALGDFDEVHGTLSNWDTQRLADTYTGVDSKVKLESQDIRVFRHMVKYAADEVYRKDENTSALKIGDDKSALLKSLNGDVAKAKLDVARDFATALSTVPKQFLAAVGAASTDMEKGMQGKINLDLFGQQVTSVQELVGWIQGVISENPPGAVARYTDTRGEIQAPNIKIIEQALVNAKPPTTAGGAATPATAPGGTATAPEPDEDDTP